MGGYSFCLPGTRRQMGSSLIRSSAPLAWGSREILVCSGGCCLGSRAPAGGYPFGPHKCICGGEASGGVAAGLFVHLVQSG